MQDSIFIIPMRRETISPERKVLGLNLSDRILLSAKKNGFTRENKDGIPVYSNVLLSDGAWKNLRESGAIPLTMKDRIVLQGEKDLAGAEKWLLNSLIKDSEGFMSRHLERKISLFITKHLVNTPVTPNLMTLFSMAIGLAGAFFFTFGSRGHQVTGALLFWFHSVLDGCDGEIARLKFMESRWGGLLDFWSDNIVHSAVFCSIAYAQKEAVPGVLAVVGTFLSAGLVYWRTMRNNKEGGPLFTSVIALNKKGSFEKAMDFLARRDFIYLVIILSIFGKAEWFLWMGAIGAPIYFLILLSAGRNRLRNT